MAIGYQKFLKVYSFIKKSIEFYINPPKFHNFFHANVGDPMKRSLMNQLTSHLMLGMLLNNNLVTPFFTWRLLIGPLNSFIATFVAFIENIVVTWNVLAITLMSLVKTLLTFKWSLMARTNDLFMGRYLFWANFVFCLFSHTTRYFLGSMYESHEFQILSGIKVSIILDKVPLINGVDTPNHFREIQN